ncbi:hypothetical protein DM860_005186 [Cuscuta australis]|uniref:Uncharacterized protein n=1 Tax=Cuscuta australis TaxID=267555 RepID=A0A328DML0_9ASTE|nr:hypothetical protein DM860_005186 [Cuscuta australis]
MEPPRGFLASLCNFIRFLPYFIALLILGFLKGSILCPIILLIITIGNSAVVLGLWPVHLFYTYYSILSTKQLGPVLKAVICICLPVVLSLWLVIAIVSSIIGGAAYGFFSPMLATSRAVEPGKDNKFYHCICDGTWDTVKRSFTIVRDVGDVSYHSYFSFMDDLRLQGAGKYYEFRLLYLPGTLIGGLLGIIVDMPMITMIAAYKTPYMLFRGWHRLFHDCIGREGPFLETICVPFAGIAILLWPLAVAGALLGSMVSSIFLGAYAGAVVYQESSFWLGLCYIVASLSIYDEYSNDVLDLPEGSCFPRPQYRTKNYSRTSSRTASFSRPTSFRNSFSSHNTPMVELKHIEFANGFFKECQRYGEILVSEGVLTQKDIEDAKSNKDIGRILSIGLPAFGVLQILLRSAKANSSGLLLKDDNNNSTTEISSTNRPKDAFYDWFLNPLLIMKDQIKADNLSESEEEYLGKLVLLYGDSERLNRSNIDVLKPASELRRAELDALARRLHGITKSISRYPTYRRRFDSSMKAILNELAAKKDGDSRTCGAEASSIPRSRSMFARIFSQKSLDGSKNGSDPEAQTVSLGKS